MREHRRQLLELLDRLVESLKNRDASIPIDEIAAGGDQNHVIGAISVLETLGIVSLDSGRVCLAASSETAALHMTWMLRSLREFANSESPVLDDFHIAGTTQRWVRVLYQMESQRASFKEAVPIRGVEVAKIVVVAEVSGKRALGET